MTDTVHRSRLEYAHGFVIATGHSLLNLNARTNVCHSAYARSSFDKWGR
jgi:hypothetical protein